MPARRNTRDRLAAFVPEWEAVPWTLWVVVALSLIAIPVFFVRGPGDTPVGLVIAFPFVVLAWNYLLLTGLRWVWITTLVLAGGGLVLELAASTGTWWGDLESAVVIVLLLLPTTRRFFQKDQTAATA